MSGSRTRSPVPGPQARRPNNGNQLSPDPNAGGNLPDPYSQFNGRTLSGGQYGGQQFQQSATSEANFAKQSSQRQEVHSNSTARRSEEYKESFERTSRAMEEYRTRTSIMVSLADCQLDLELPMLVIKPRSDADFNTTTINLDEFVGNIDGQLVWGATKFTESCESIRLQGTLLLASCPRGRDEFVQARLDLTDHITYNTARRRFFPVSPDPEFTELMASARWMNFTVITRPDMRGFLASPAFRNAVTSVAQRAVDEVMTQMKEVMALAVEEAVAMVSAKSDEYVQNEMEHLIRMATKSAAYSGLAQLTMMSQHQIRAYDDFAPSIGAPSVRGEDVDAPAL
ncbi:hypothetical protein DFH06DRAFT_1193218 [Mycena polygramma]|nr:hypothetical protein DFH06DRAFT_1193218 [Mycena polygramma]